MGSIGRFLVYLSAKAVYGLFMGITVVPMVGISIIVRFCENIMNSYAISRDPNVTDVQWDGLTVKSFETKPQEGDEYVHIEADEFGLPKSQLVRLNQDLEPVPVPRRRHRHPQLARLYDGRTEIRLPSGGYLLLTEDEHRACWTRDGKSSHEFVDDLLRSPEVRARIVPYSADDIPD